MGDALGGRVGEKVGQRSEQDQDLGGDGKASEFGGSQTTDDDRVGGGVERFNGQRSEGGQRKGPDSAI
jgi:hypothetical protein